MRSGSLAPKLIKNNQDLEDELAARIGLYSIPGIGGQRLSRLVTYFGSGIAAWKAGEQLVTEALGSRELAERLHEWRQRFDAVRIYQDLLAQDIRVVCLDLPETEYPHVLAQLPQAPFMLFRKGTIQAVDTHALAVVGTRKPTEYGVRVTRQFVTALVERGVTIISGLARGVDGIAHRTAIASGGRTIAILGGSIDTVYPPEHRELAGEIVKHGALLSQYLPGQAANPGQFAARNRLIAGLSLGVLITEAAAKSGTQITAHYAINQTKPVFAIPGELGKPMSEGPLELAKHGAQLVTQVDDIFERLPKLIINSPPTQREISKHLTGDEAIVWELLAQGPMAMDTIVRTSELAVPAVSAALLNLELEGLVQKSGEVYAVVS